MRIGLFNSTVFTAAVLAVGTTNAVTIDESDPSKVPSILTQSSTDSGASSSVSSEAYANLAAELKTMTSVDCGAEAEA